MVRFSSTIAPGTLLSVRLLHRGRLLHRRSGAALTRGAQHERAAARKSQVADIVGVVFYSVIALLLTLGWMYVPPEAVISVAAG